MSGSKRAIGTSHMAWRKRQRILRKARSLNALQQAQVSTIVHRQLARGQERKFVDIASAGSIGTTTVITPLTNIITGVSNVTRIGNTIQPTSIELRFDIHSQTAGDLTNVYRFLLFQWKNDTGETGAEVPPTAAGLFSVTSVAFSHLIYNQRSNFKVIMDRQFPLSFNGPSEITKVIRLRKKFLPIKYTTGTTSGINKLYVAELSDSTIATHPVANWVARVRYTDD